MKTSSTPRRARERGFNLVGYINGNLGLGVAARNTLARLLASGESVQVACINPGATHAGLDSTYAHLDAPTRDTARSVNLFHINPPEAIGHQLEWRDCLDIESSVNACVPFWELPHLPPSWVMILKCMDFVLAPTRFIEQACLECLPAPQVLYYPQTIELPKSVDADRTRWSIPDTAVAFLVTFDINSDIRRKNPWGAIDAFARAFPDDPQVHLVVRVNGTPATPVLFEQMKALQRRANVDRRISLVTEPLSYDDVLTLYESCDVLIGLHRAEGLGLHLMEAMSLGKPVVATAWSGNMDFMDADSSCLVPVREFIPVEATQAAYAAELIGPNQCWAEPDIAAASEYLQRLASDKDYRERIGSRARTRIDEHLETARANMALQTLASTDIRRLRGTLASRRRIRAFKRLIHAQDTGRPLRTPIEAVKHTAVVVLRMLGLMPPEPEHERLSREAHRRSNARSR